MTDDISLRGPADQLRIGLDDPEEVIWWAKKFDVTEMELRDAVEAVGNVAANVSDHLAKRENSQPQHDAH